MFGVIVRWHGIVDRCHTQTVNTLRLDSDGERKNNNIKLHKIKVERISIA